GDASSTSTATAPTHHVSSLRKQGPNSPHPGRVTIMHRKRHLRPPPPCGEGRGVGAALPKMMRELQAAQSNPVVVAPPSSGLRPPSPSKGEGHRTEVSTPNDSPSQDSLLPWWEKAIEPKPPHPTTIPVRTP